MDDMCLLSSCLDRHSLVKKGKFIPKSEPFDIENYCVTIINSKYEAEYRSVMMDSSHAIFCTMRSTNKDSIKILMYPAKMISQKKLLTLKFEYLHVEPLINSLLTTFCALEFPECHSHNIFDDDDDGKKIYSVHDMKNTLEFHTNIYQLPHNETVSIKIKIKKNNQHNALF